MDAAVVEAHQAFEQLLYRLNPESGTKVSRGRVSDVLTRLLIAAPALHPSQTEVARGEIREFVEGEPHEVPFIPVPYVVPPDAVSRTVAALKADGVELITERRPRRDRPGRPYTPLELGSKKWAMIGVKFGHRGGVVTELSVLVTGLDGTPLDLPGYQNEHQPYIKLLNADDGHDVVTALARVIEELCALEEVKQRYVLGIGVEIAGHVFEGDVVDASLNDMFDVNVGTLLSEKLDHSLAARLDPLLGGHYPLPVVVDNDLNVLGVHETYRPRSPERNIAVVAVFDDGVGSALIVDGRVYRGGNGMAGEIGHLYVPMDLSGLPEPPALENEASAQVGTSNKRPAWRFSDECYCAASKGPAAGIMDHLDCYAPSERLCGQLGVAVEDLEKVAATAVTSEDQPTPKSLVFGIAGRALGTALASLINLTNPSRILLFLPPALAEPAPGTVGEKYLQKATEAIEKHVFSDGAEETVLKVYALDPESRRFRGTKAAAIRVIDSLLQHATFHCRCYTPKIDRKAWEGDGSRWNTKDDGPSYSIPEYREHMGWT